MHEKQSTERQVRIPFRELRPPRSSPCVVVSIGRCGSTLIVAALRRIGANAINEPAYCTQVAKMWIGGAEIPRGVSALIARATGLFGEQSIIKLDPRCIHTHSLYWGGFENPLLVAVFREPVAWAVSMRRIDRSITPHVLAKALAWAVRSFADMRQRRPVLTLYYEDFAHDLRGLEPLATLLGLPTPDFRIDDDVHATTVIAQNMLPAKDHAFGEAFAKEWQALRPAALIDSLGLKYL